MSTVSFDQLGRCALVPGDVYEGGSAGTSGDDPISKLCHVGNFGGFRPLGSWSVPGALLVVLYTTEDQHEWPDVYDPTNARLVYFGDNRDIGTDARDALEGKKGNQLLAQTFAALRTDRRASVPPFFVFRKAGSNGRAVEFLGLAAPGAPGLSEGEELVAFWTTLPEGRFLNYRAVFTLLDVPVVSRAWVEEIRDSRTHAGPSAPGAWQAFVERGEYRAARVGQSS